MKNRIKKSVTTPITREQAETAMSALALAQNAKRMILAQIDKKKLAIDEHHAVGLADADICIATYLKRLQLWAEQNPAEFEKRKSVELAAGTLGFRTGNFKCVPLNRTWKWDAILAKVDERLPEFIRLVPEVDKEGLIRMREDAFISPILPEVGIKIVQEETFYVEPKLADTTARETEKVGA